MPNRTVILPSGLSGEVRGLRTREANMLADAKNARAGTSFDQILAACWVSTQSPGPYAVKADGSFAWGDVLVCDRTAAIMAIRVATYGSEYVFSVRCASETCLKKFDWALDLVQDITTKPLPAESLVTFAKDNRFESMLPGLGRKFWFKLQTGRDEQRASEDEQGAHRHVRDQHAHHRDRRRACERPAALPRRPRDGRHDGGALATRCCRRRRRDRPRSAMRALRRGARCRAPFRAGVLYGAETSATEDDAGNRVGLGGVFPPIDGNELWDKVFHLLWTQHGGSGLRLSFDDVMALDWSRLEWFYTRLCEQRAEEHRQLSKK
jgi:hypothetical protein